MATIKVNGIEFGSIGTSNDLEHCIKLAKRRFGDNITWEVQELVDN
jgi:hypothetical protein